MNVKFMYILSSLQDVLHNSSLKLDAMFLMSMAFDIARVSRYGICYL